MSGCDAMVDAPCLFQANLEVGPTLWMNDVDMVDEALPAPFLPFPAHDVSDRTFMDRALANR
jgi:hypothetical protein